MPASWFSVKHFVQFGRFCFVSAFLSLPCYKYIPHLIAYKGCLLSTECFKRVSLDALLSVNIDSEWSSLTSVISLAVLTHGNC